MPDFQPALELSAGFYAEVIAPLLGDRPHVAARLGDGSEVLGLDTARSTDHDWGPAVEIFTDQVAATRALIEPALPETFRGWAVRVGSDRNPLQHRVTVASTAEWFTGFLGATPPLSTVDWLVVPQQRLLGATRGRVHHDPDGELAALRRGLAYFPDPIWRWLLAAQWGRIGQVVAFVGRAAEVGDELGSRQLAGHIVRELMRLAFLLERTYWPYQKWFGTAFATLPIAGALEPALTAALAASDYPAREAALVTAYELLARRHNAGGITAPGPARARPYFSRPFQVIAADEFAAVTLATVTDPVLRALPLVGSVDQFGDSTDLASAQGHGPALRALYDRLPGPH